MTITPISSLREYGELESSAARQARRTKKAVQQRVRKFLEDAEARAQKMIEYATRVATITCT